MTSPETRLPESPAPHDDVLDLISPPRWLSLSTVGLVVVFVILVGAQAQELWKQPGALGDLIGGLADRDSQQAASERCLSWIDRLPASTAQTPH